MRNHRAVHAVVLVAAASAFAVGAHPAVADSWTEVRSRNEHAVVFITATYVAANEATDTWTGTGFIVSPDGYVLTNSHVIPEQGDGQARTITASVGSRYERPYPLKVVQRDAVADLLLAKLPEGRSWSHVALGSSADVSLEAEVLALGFPLKENLNSGVGRITSKDGPDGRWLTSLALNPGNSGGPVFDSHGQVVAVARGGLRGAQLINEIVPIQYAQGLLQSANVKVASAKCRSVSDVRRIVASQLGAAPEEIDVAMPLGAQRVRDFRPDEMDMLKIIMALEEECDIVLKDGETSDIDRATVEALAQAVQRAEVKH